ncbi:SEC-C domain-containing protein [Iamia sp. SCSIO 61187]|uniref:YecA family protein n=1 Tax=Iamia sp. SCSIO 61187 TaxID=2722752 RepID=UPI001C62FCEA|nr:SEC-C metal-binding domain-containing protein [Iamia sp. SCSIO 61187]QYG95201.1 SEC-C domain-containing protein [Iamia sp. SCSIO 61187]
MTAWHRLAADEASERQIRIGLDGLLVWVALPAVEVVLVGDDTVELQPDPTPHPVMPGLPVISLPDTWEPGLAADDLVGLVLDGEHLRLVRADHGTAAGPAAVGHLRTAFEELGRDLGTPPTNADGWVLDLRDVVPDLLADHRSVIRALRQPFEEALDAAGMAHAGPMVGGTGITEEQLVLHAVGRQLLASAGLWDDDAPIEQVGVLWLALMAPADSGDEVPTAVGPLLGTAEIVSVVAANLRQAPTTVVDHVARRIRSVAPAPTIGPMWLLALVALHHGMARAARDLLAKAAVTRPPQPGDGWNQAWELLGELEAVAGDVDAAQRTWQLAGADERGAQLDPWRPIPPKAVGRNETCPCGSGRKFKQCCLRRPATPDLAARAPFVWWKVQTWALTHHLDDLPFTNSLVGPGPMERLIFSVQAYMAEGEGLDRILDELEDLLPDDEVDLARSWSATRHRLWKVESVTADGGAQLREAATGEVVTVPAAPRAHELVPGRHVIGLVVAGPGSSHLVGHSLPVRPDALDPARQALADELDERALRTLVRDVADLPA